MTPPLDVPGAGETLALVIIIGVALVWFVWFVVRLAWVWWRR